LQRLCILKKNHADEQFLARRRLRELPETIDRLSQQIREAAAIVPLERLALGTQCGFSTSIVGNAITEDEQRRKLTTIAETAARIWG